MKKRMICIVALFAVLAMTMAALPAQAVDRTPLGSDAHQERQHLGRQE